MKNILISYIAAFFLIIAIAGCEQEVLTYTRPQPDEPTPETPAAGSADFSKFVAVGNSLVAGFQSAALFSEGQANSLPLILNKQFQEIEGEGGGSATFNQPDINSENGYNPTLSAPPSLVLGKLILKGNPPVLTPLPGDLPTAFTGDKTALNNFGVPGILLAQALIPETGTPGNAIENPYYTRFASAPGTSTLIGDAVAAQGTFFLFWLGNNDVLGYATTGGSGIIPMTAVENFQMQYVAALQAMTTDPTIKGVVGNIPDVTSIPFFTTVAYNAVTFSENSAQDGVIVSLLNTNYEIYNAGLAGAQQNQIITQEEATARQITFGFGKNSLVIEDENLTEITLPDGQGGFVTLPKIRQMKMGELVTLTAGAIIGRPKNPDDPFSIWGLAEPLTDRHVLVQPELDSIKARVEAFNVAIEGAISTLGVSDRVAVADIKSTLAALATQGSYTNNVLVTASISPPFAGFSLDGVHPNSRGYALAANTFIDAINAKFGAKVPKVDLADYGSNALPIP